METLTHMVKSKFSSVREIAHMVLNELADAYKKIHKNNKTVIGIKGLLDLCKSEDYSVQKIAFDTLAEEIWLDSSKQKEIIALG